MKKTWTKSDEEKRLCLLWLEEPLINPETGCKIIRNGPTFKEWLWRCQQRGITSKPKATHKLSWNKCQLWKQNPDINPDTGRKIKVNSTTYKWLEKECGKIKEKPDKFLGEWYVPDNNGLVPCVNNNNTFYVIRLLKQDNIVRKVWGPLNKPVQKIWLIYFKDTWDYKNGLYCPIFLNIEPTRPFSNHKTIFHQNIHELETKNPKKITDELFNLFVK